MATIKVCDRCGAQINPERSGTLVKFEKDWRYSQAKYDRHIIDSGMFTESNKAIELCVSCAHALREWLNNNPFPKEESK